MNLWTDYEWQLRVWWHRQQRMPWPQPCTAWCMSRWDRDVRHARICWHRGRTK